MTDIALMRALVRWAEAIRKRSGRVTGRRAMSMYCALRTKILRGPEKNRHTRRAEAAQFRKAMREARRGPR